MISKRQSPVFAVHEVIGGNGGVVPHILYLCTGFRGSVRFTRSTCVWVDHRYDACCLGEKNENTFRCPKYSHSSSVVQPD